MYMIWCGRINLSNYFDTICGHFPWMNKQQTKTPNETMSNFVSLVSLAESLIHSPCKSWHKVFFLRSQYIPAPVTSSVKQYSSKVVSK